MCMAFSDPSGQKVLNSDMGIKSLGTRWGTFGAFIMVGVSVKKVR